MSAAENIINPATGVDAAAFVAGDLDHAAQTRAAEAARYASPKEQVIGVATMIGTASSNQVGAAIGAMAFPFIGPFGVVAVRQFTAAIVLMSVARPKLRTFTWSQWWPVLLLAVVLGTMNLTLYVAIDRLGLGMAVTLEFLGPLGVALFAGRSRLTLLCGAIAATGVVVLTAPGPTTDVIGLSVGLVSALCWASYILLNRVIGRRMPGVQGAAAASLVSSIFFIPVFIIVMLHAPFTIAALGLAVVAGIMCSAIPFAADLITLRRVPTHVFGIFMSINPFLAAVSGAVLLHQMLGLHEWIGMGLIIVANIMAVLLSRRSAALSARGGASGPRRSILPFSGKGTVSARAVSIRPKP
ncbi:EamA family transporter [Lysinibacter cavernae]|uniref:Inner membrane transporter RhtA n=1 Tax=Lysinibacter cavernae TaxID=1640652 RepID=A0A7X5R260_9MICO|nr:EamA family transporter [Lysinibacter cavernae]NIH54298.1 inner membrane transporter RhtA [Lysinibacter cavernae]